MGVNFDRESYCGAYILSEKELDVQELNAIVSSHHLYAGLQGKTVWRNDQPEYDEATMAGAARKVS